MIAAYIAIHATQKYAILLIDGVSFYRSRAGVKGAFMLDPSPNENKLTPFKPRIKVEI